MDLVEQAIKRQDDLRQAENHATVEQFSHIQEVLALRADFAKEIRQLETDRVNAVRQIDVAAVKTEAERVLAAVQTLAAQTASDRETLRTQSAATVGQLIERIAALEKSSYEGKGKEAVSDPMLAKMVVAIDNLRADMTRSTGKGEGYEKVWGWIVGAIGGGGVLGFLIERMLK
jgi:hypothetical protein